MKIYYVPFFRKVINDIFTASQRSESVVFYVEELERSHKQWVHNVTCPTSLHNCPIPNIGLHGIWMSWTVPWCSNYWGLELEVVVICYRWKNSQGFFELVLSNPAVTSRSIQIYPSGEFHRYCYEAFSPAKWLKVSLLLRQEILSFGVLTFEAIVISWKPAFPKSL